MEERMKTRIIHTKIHDDEWFTTLTPVQRYFFIYLFTNHRIGHTGIYEISDRTILFETAISSSQLSEFKKLLEDKEKALFHNGWVFVVKSSTYGGYVGEKNQRAWEKELVAIPVEIMVYFNDTVSIPYRYPIDTTINNKSKIINNKSETINTGKVVLKEKIENGRTVYTKE